MKDKMASYNFLAEKWDPKETIKYEKFADVDI